MRTLTLVAVLTFASSLVAALLLLPAEVEMLFAPGSTPDATYPAWAYVLVVTGMWLVGSFFGASVVGAFRSLRDAMLPRGRASGVRSGPLQLATVMCSAIGSVTVWLALAFPTDQLNLRFALSGVAQSLVLGGVFVAGWLRLRNPAKKART